MDTEAESDIRHDNESAGSPAICPEGSDSKEQAQAVSLKRNARYYLSLVNFRVGNQLFRVPREGFTSHSQVFRDMFALSPSNEKSREGESDENPIHLEQIDEGAFEDLLQLLYPDRPNGLLFLRFSGESLVDRWLSVLDLAHMWQFKNIREHCIKQLEEYGLDMIRTIVVAHKYEITQWYLGAYVKLASRKEPLTFDESQHFTKDFMVKLARVRELEIARRVSMGSDNEALEEDVKRIFSIDEPVSQSTNVDTSSSSSIGFSFATLATSGLATTSDSTWNLTYLSSRSSSSLAPGRRSVNRPAKRLPRK